MANQQTDEKETPVVITLSALKDMMSALVAEMKKPFVDPDIVARNLAAKMRLRAQREESERDLAAIQDSCPHMRDDNTSAVAWHEQFWRARKLYIREGFCQRCNKHFFPGLPGYVEMLRVPTGKAGVIQ